MRETLHTVPFYKMHGSGNDFILFDNRVIGLTREEMPDWALKLCPRAFAVGADGMIFLDLDDRNNLDYIWHFFNSDGSRAEMCGNGSRCASLLAYKIGLAGRNQIFGTDAGPVKAMVLDEGLVKVQLTAPRELALDITLTLDDRHEVNVHRVNTGVPHAVVICESVKKVDVARMGKAIRFHRKFSPSGTNVNFIQILNSDSILLRTYERGVEKETFACGTGAAASVVVGSSLGLVQSPVRVTTSGGEELSVDISGNDVFLTGNAVMVYKGELMRHSFGL